MVLCLFHHFAVFLFLKKRLEIGEAVSGLRFCRLSVPDQVSHLLQLEQSVIVFRIQVIQTDVNNQNDLLAVVVKGNHLVEQHQVNILESLGVHGVQMKRGFCIFQIIIGEITNQPAGERGKVVKAGTLVLLQDLTDKVSRIFGIEGE